MNPKHICIALAAALVPAHAVYAQDKPKSEPIYGYRMMTPQERDEYRARMRAATNTEERQKIRDEHHKAMTERGMKPGAGMGPGRGMGRNK